MSLVKTFFNFVVVLVFIGTPTVTYWRGSWHILDLYAFPKCGIPCTWITTGISFGVIYVVVFCHEYNKAYIENSQVRAVFLLVLIYPLAFIIVTFWRGIWLLLDHYTTISLFSGLVCHFVGFFIVLLTKTTSSIVPAPGYTVMERINDPADFALQLKVCFSKDKSLRMLNCFLTVFVIGTAVVIYWRGTWVSLDVLSMGQASNKLRSSIISAVVGFGIVFICYCSSESLKSRILIVRTPFPLWWGTLEHGFVYILGFGVVNFWRGLWYLEDIFLLPELKPAYDALMCHVFGVCILYGLQGILNLTGPPAGCRVHGSETLEGFDMGSFLGPALQARESENEEKGSASAQEIQAGVTTEKSDVRQP